MEKIACAELYVLCSSAYVRVNIVLDSGTCVYLMFYVYLCTIVFLTSWPYKCRSRVLFCGDCHTSGGPESPL